MTDVQKLKRLYILLRWYSWYFAEKPEELLDEDTRLMLELEKEVLEIQKRLNTAKKPKKKKK
jgi:hypothetical protein